MYIQTFYATVNKVTTIIAALAHDLSNVADNDNKCHLSPVTTLKNNDSILNNLLIVN